MSKSSFPRTNDYRTALNSIIGFSKLLIDEVSGPLNNEQKSQIESIYSAGYHLLEHLQTFKPKIICFFYNEDNDLELLKKEIIQRIQNLSNKKVLNLNIEDISEPELQKVREQHQYVLIWAPIDNQSKDQDFFKCCDDIVIISNTLTEENENQVKLLLTLPHLATKFNFLAPVLIIGSDALQTFIYTKNTTFYPLYASATFLSKQTRQAYVQPCFPSRKLP